MTSVGQNLFEALRDGLADFRAKVEGEPGRKVVALGHKGGTIPDLIRTVLEAVADALAWLAGALAEAESVLDVVDAAVALVEVAGRALEAATEGFSFGDFPAAVGLPAGPFQAVEQGLAAGHDAIVTGERVLTLVPRPEHIAAVRGELEKLLGKRANPALKDAGSLGKLLVQVEKTNTP